MHTLKRRCCIWMLGLPLMLAATPLRAGTFVWTGADNLNPAWNNPANWTGAGVGFPNVPDDVAEFMGTATTTTLTVGQQITVGQIIFGTSQNITINPGAFGSLTFASVTNTPLLINVGAGGFTNTGVDTIAAPIIFGSGQEPTPPNLQIVAGGGALHLSGGLSGQGGLNVVMGPGSNVLVAKPGDAAYGASYAGPTTVQGGTLEMHNVLLSSGVTVGSADQDGTFKGTGTVGGITVVGAIQHEFFFQPGSTLFPGATPGILTSTGNVSFGMGANFQVELDGNSPSPQPGTDYSQLLGQGTVDITGANLKLSFANFMDVPGAMYDIIHAPGGVTGTFAQGSTITAGGHTFQIVYSADDVVLTLAAVPEPRSLALLGAGLLGILARRQWSRHFSVRVVTR